MTGQTHIPFIAIGLIAGIASGLFGIGGGLVMVPLLVLATGFDQHRAHVTSLDASILLAVGGAVVYGIHDRVEVRMAILIAAGAIFGAPLGAYVMNRTPQGRLKAAFGALLIVLSLVLVLT